jgi:hypothetical protein
MNADVERELCTFRHVGGPMHGMADAKYELGGGGEGGGKGGGGGGGGGLRWTAQCQGAHLKRGVQRNQ